MAKRTREIEGVQRRYEWSLFPSAEQYAALQTQAEMCADLWNVLLNLCERLRDCRIWINHDDGPCVFGLDESIRQIRLSEIWQNYRLFGGRLRLEDMICRAAIIDKSDLASADGIKLKFGMPSEFDIGYWISEMRKASPEWGALSTWTPRRVATSLAAAWQAFFQRCRNGDGGGYPRYKSRRHASTIPHRAVSGCSIRETGNSRNWLIRMQGVPGEVRARGEHKLIELPPLEWTDVDLRKQLKGIHGSGAREPLLAGSWLVSAAMVVDSRRAPGQRPVSVTFDCLDGFAIVDNALETPSELIRAQHIERACDQRQGAFDLHYPRNGRLSDPEHEAMSQERREMQSERAYAARVRHNALHVWTARIVRRASALIITVPAISATTRTAKGNNRDWGAAVSDVGEVNRTARSYAPATAVAMLKYKAAEAGIPCGIRIDEAPKLALSAVLKTAAKAVRLIVRETKRRVA